MSLTRTGARIELKILLEERVSIIIQIILNFSFCPYIYFLTTSKNFLMKSGFSLVDSNVIFPIQSSEFTKSLYFESNSNKILDFSQLRIQEHPLPPSEVAIFA